MPSNNEIERCLQRVVREAISSGEEITVNSARQRVEAELDLEDDFFKGDAQWKQKSKEVIHAAFEAPSEPRSETAKQKPAPQANAPKAKPGAKRKSADAQPAKKRRKVVVEASDSDGSDDGEEEHKEEAGSEDEVGEDDGASDKSEPASGAPSTAEQDADGDSDMSVLIDEPPRKRGGKKSTAGSQAKSKAKDATAKQSKALSPDEEEIKRLQGWLIKCGLRKMWSRELAPYSTAKDKIRHLKQLLADVGMTGRFSAEKAKQIKEARELAAEIQSAQEFNEAFGAKGDDDDSDGGKPSARPRKPLPKGFIDFGDSGDDESD